MDEYIGLDALLEEFATRIRELLAKKTSPAPPAPNDGPCNCEQALELQRLLDESRAMVAKLLIERDTERAESERLHLELVRMANARDALNAAIDRLHRHHIDAIKSMRYALARLLNEQQQLSGNKP